MASSKIKKDIEVTLTLNKEEAVFLASILGYIGGSPSSSPRKIADKIRIGAKLEDFAVELRTSDFKTSYSGKTELDEGKEENLLANFGNQIFFKDDTYDKFKELVDEVKV